MSLLMHKDGAVLRLTLDRPDVSNAFDEALIERLTVALRDDAADPEVRVVLLQASGKYFSAGADLHWMRRAAAQSEAKNLVDARKLAELMRSLDACPKPTIARVQGSAFAGAVGLLACCDLVLAVPEAQFAITEVRIGLIPAVISPYLRRAMGARQLRRWSLTAERFSAEQACRMGLVHEVVPAERLDAAITLEIDALLRGSPDAQAETKSLLAAIDRPLDADVILDTAHRIARQRASVAGREGIGAFLEKRRPAWQESER